MGKGGVGARVKTDRPQVRVSKWEGFIHKESTLPDMEWS